MDSRTELEMALTINPSIVHIISLSALEIPLSSATAPGTTLPFNYTGKL